ncbi:MAG: hypothetical protein A4E52_01766 [Pelotomaculum sp. PtaB.Bin013]|nr:MAG: hypothetical protein A4E52_01766 [Pelotomaculum sp. PtaB.Bin013]
MRWEEVRRIYADQYVLVKILKSRMEGNKEVIEDVAVLRNITDPAEATRELVRCKGDTLVYHTGNKEIVVEIRTRPGYWGVI